MGVVGYWGPYSWKYRLGFTFGLTSCLGFPSSSLHVLMIRPESTSREQQTPAADGFPQSAGHGNILFVYCVCLCTCGVWAFQQEVPFIVFWFVSITRVFTISYFTRSWREERDKSLHVSQWGNQRLGIPYSIYNSLKNRGPFLISPCGDFLLICIMMRISSHQWESPKNKFWQHISSSRKPNNLLGPNSVRK